MSEVEAALAEIGHIEIEITEDIEAMANEAILALVKDVRSDGERIYQRGGKLVHIVPSESPGEETVQTIRVVGLPTLLERLSAVADWGRTVTDPKDETKTKWKPCKPPRDVVAAVEARGHWAKICHLVGITVTPVLRPDGTILQKPGYDGTTGLLYAPPAADYYPSIPEYPTQLEVEAARWALDEVVIDFPFASSSDYAAWFAALLTVLARPAIKGNTPFFVVDAPTRGSGKGKSIDAIACIATGRPMPTTTMVASEEETRKKITTLILEGKDVVHWDNVQLPIGGESLESLATSATWQDRILGKNASAELPKKIVCFFSGNNVQYKGDAARRVLPIRIVPDVEHPEDRTNFLHRDLLGWITANRAGLVAAALTVLRAWVVAGRPVSAPGAYGSFEAWHDTVVQAVRWIGFPDPMGVRVGIEERNDPSKAALVHIVESWQAAFGQRGTTARQIYDRLGESAHAELRGSFQVLAANDTGLTSRAVGEILSKHKDRVVSGRIVKTRGKSEGVALWTCEKTG